MEGGFEYTLSMYSDIQILNQGDGNKGCKTICHQNYTS
jgi:hypothetical protein